MLIGIDGADPVIVERLIGAGRLPTFARLARDGVLARLRSREPLLSPILWTTIATGRKPQDHGVLDFVEASDDGKAVPITSARRRVPALWNIATAFGRSSGFIGWYASFPVEPVRGFEVSDRVAFHQVTSGPIPQGAAYPPSLAAALPGYGQPAIDVAAVRRRFLSRADASLTVDGEQRVSQLARMFATAEYYRHLARRLQREQRPELLGVYFEIVDACSHLFMEDAPPARPQVASLDFAAFSSTVDRCYEYQDEVLGDLLAMADADTLTIVCSDHGFKSGERRPDTPGRADEGQAALWHLADGLVALHGANVRRGASLHDASILDVTPTVLRTLAIPLARDLPGRPLRDAFSGGPLAREAERTASYEFVPVPPPAAADADAPAKIAELRALGYLTGPADAPRPARDGRFAASYLNEGVALYVDGEHRDALRAFMRGAELDPRNVNARAFAARIHIERRDFDAAAALLDQAVTLDPKSVYVRLLRANLAIGTQQWALAERELAAAEALDRRLPMLYLQRARLLAARGDPAQALDALATAERLTDAGPMLFDILMLRADAAGRLGRLDEVDAAVKRAAPLASPEQIAIARSEVAIARNDVDGAVAQLRAALDRSPRSASLWAALGATHGRAGDFDRSIDAYERAVAIEPSALACKTLAALVLEVRRDRTRAVELWERSLELDRDQPDVRRYLHQFGGRPAEER